MWEEHIDFAFVRSASWEQLSIQVTEIVTICRPLSWSVFHQICVNIQQNRATSN